MRVGMSVIEGNTRGFWGLEYSASLSGLSYMGVFTCKNSLGLYIYYLFIFLSYILIQFTLKGYMK